MGFEKLLAVPSPSPPKVRSEGCGPIHAGEARQDAIHAAQTLQSQGVGSIFTLLGENVTSPEGEAVRVLISYGPAWFPWYMRRLAERPANIWLVLKNMFRS